jgi:hypothetical protein
MDGPWLNSMSDCWNVKNGLLNCLDYLGSGLLLCGMSGCLVTEVPLMAGHMTDHTAGENFQDVSGAQLRLQFRPWSNFGAKP